MLRLFPCSRLVLGRSGLRPQTAEGNGLHAPCAITTQTCLPSGSPASNLPCSVDFSLFSVFGPSGQRVCSSSSYCHLWACRRPKISLGTLLLVPLSPRRQSLPPLDVKAQKYDSGPGPPGAAVGTLNILSQAISLETPECRRPRPKPDQAYLFPRLSSLTSSPWCFFFWTLSRGSTSNTLTAVDS